jgi:transposase
MEKVGCARQSLITWIERKQGLGVKEKEELKQIILEKKPTDYGIDRQIWTGKIIIEVINQKWGVQIKDSRIYDILKEIGLSHQKAHREAHRDYENSDRKAQEEFISTRSVEC